MMDLTMLILLGVNGFFCIGIFIYFGIVFFKHYKKDRNGVVNYFPLIGMLYLILALFFLLWGLGVFEYSELDFVFIYSIMMVVQSVALIGILYSISKKRNLFFILLFYVVVIILGFHAQSFFRFKELVLIASFLIYILIFNAFASLKSEYRSVGYIGISYSALSLALVVLFFFKPVGFLLLNTISNAGFFLLARKWYVLLKRHPFSEKIVPRKSSFFINLLRCFVFIITIVNLVFIGTMGVHEFGHYSVLNFYGCRYNRIVYENSFSYTESLCGDVPINFVILGGVLLPFVIALVLFVIGGRVVKEISFLIFGFNLIACYKDFIDLGFSNNLALSSVMFGVLFLILGIVDLARGRTSDVVFGFA